MAHPVCISASCRVKNATCCKCALSVSPRRRVALHTALGERASRRQTYRPTYTVAWHWRHNWSTVRHTSRPITNKPSSPQSIRYMAQWTTSQKWITQPKHNRVRMCELWVRRVSTV